MSPQSLIPCSNNKSPAAQYCDVCDSNFDTETPASIHNEIDGIKKPVASKGFDDWILKRDQLGVPESKSILPFLVGAAKSTECRVCESAICPGEGVVCCIPGCKGSYHLTCARDRLGLLQSVEEFKCPQHVCFLCKKKSKNLWRCSICHLASHDTCAAYPEYVIHSQESTKVICWRHVTESPPLEPAAPIDSIEGLFCRLRLPYMVEEFNVAMLNNLAPPSYIPIKRNIYLIKKKRENVGRGNGCTSCDSGICVNGCMCRLQSISCSKACKCSEMCTNKPFRKEKKTRVVMTECCGWGLEAAEPIKKGDFIIEYVGEVIDDELCEQRFWENKNEGATNFYLCEVRKNFTIDATFKGNASRFMNHSCDPNCNLEKWEVDGETRLGVFATKAISAGEALTYNYRFVQYGPHVKCSCGAPNCRGYLGVKKKTLVLKMHSWGLTYQRNFIK